MNNNLVKAALLHFKSELARNETNLEIYLKNGVGVAEHPDVVENVIELTKKIAEADECIKILKKFEKEKK